MSYISIKLYKKVIDHAIAEGVSRNYFNSLPIPIDLIDSIKSVPADHFFELHERLEKITAHGFSVRVGQQMKIEDYGVLGLSWKTCSWVGEIFARSERYFKLLSNTYLFQIEKEKDISKIYLNRDAHRRGVELSNEATFSATVVVLSALTNSKITPVEVSFKHSPPQNQKDYEIAFNCPILFNQSRNNISFRTTDLNKPTAAADASINRFLLERVDEETKGIEFSANKIVYDVEEMIKNALPSGIPGMDEIGKIIGLSRRTLTRRLAEIGITFRDLIKKSQLEISKDLLKNTDRSIAEIAFETGFSEQSAFSRAFKNWTNLSPIEYRNKQ